MTGATVDHRTAATSADGEADVEFRAVTKRFGPLVAVNAVNLRVHKGEFLSLLGPSGCGKTTSLRMIAGFEQPDDGELLIGGRDVSGVPPYKRDVNTVFQQYALFPHMSILDNVSYGLKQRKVSKKERHQKAGEALELVRLTGRDTHRPSMLSGGQQQRVALARALATDPRMLLLDEPLAALDVSTRAEVRRDLRRHLRDFSGVNLVVTHDPLEALALADRLVVIEQGRILQSGSATEVTERPRSRYVADLVGVNLLRGRGRQGVVELESGGRLVTAGTADGEVFAVVPPRSVSLWRSRPDGSPRNVWRGRATGVDLQGDRVRVRVEGSPSLVAEVTPAAMVDLGLAEGTETWVSVKATEITVYPA
jgi:molybdate transport system ATP-binding protein